jgi:hypothetical protein
MVSLPRGSAPWRRLRMGNGCSFRQYCAMNTPLHERLAGVRESVQSKDSSGVGPSQDHSSWRSKMMSGRLIGRFTKINLRNHFAGANSRKLCGIRANIGGSQSAVRRIVLQWSPTFGALSSRPDTTLGTAAEKTHTSNSR